MNHMAAVISVHRTVAIISMTQDMRADTQYGQINGVCLLISEWLCIIQVINSFHHCSVLPLITQLKYGFHDINC